MNRLRKTGLSAGVARRSLLAALLPLNLISARADNHVLMAVKAMEDMHNLSLFTREDEIYHRWRGARIHSGRVIVLGFAISPDALTLCWGSRADEITQTAPFLTVDTLREKIKEIALPGQLAVISAVCSGAGIQVVKAHSTNGSRKQSLLAVDSRSGLTVYDITPSVVQFEIPDLEEISISGSGAVAAIGSRNSIQVIEIPSGKVIVSELGRFPRLSPDGSQLAFVNNETLLIRTLAASSLIRLMPQTRVPGVASWSPDGRFLLAGAWTHRFSLEKRQIVLDVRLGEYAEMGRLSEGDFGTRLCWVSTDLMARPIVNDRLNGVVAE